MILIDSDVLIDVLRKDARAIDRMQELAQEGDLATTSINVAEVLRGVAGRDRLVARRILAGLVEVPFGPRAALRFATLMADLDRAGTPIGAVDGLIAAVALAEGAVLWTRNVAEFRRVPGLSLASSSG